MSDQTPPDQTPAPTEHGSADVSARIASLGASRPGVTSIWPRRDETPPVPVNADLGTNGGSAQAPDLTPSASTTATSSAVTGIGRLTRVSATELWTDASAMCAWVAANADVLADLIGAKGLRFDTPSAGTVVGRSADGAVAWVVCEVGPSSDEGLGALLRTAAVQDGGTVTWISGKPSDSHVAALSWLNRATTPRFFLARATGVRIDGSATAPMFEIAVRPPRASEPDGDTAAAPRRRVGDHLPED